MEAERNELQDHIDKLRDTVNEIINERAGRRQDKSKVKKSRIQKWLKKETPQEILENYTDKALEAMLSVCNEFPQLMSAYKDSSSKLTFAFSNAGMLSRVYSALATLDSNTWVPKVENDDLRKLAQAYYDFTGGIIKGKSDVLNILQEATPSDKINYQLVDKLPKKHLESATIYIQRSGDGFDYCFLAEHDSERVEDHKQARVLGEHKDKFSDSNYFNENIKKPAPNESDPLGPRFYKETRYEKNGQRGHTIEVIREMRSDVSENMANYDDQQRRMQSRPKK